MAKSQKLLTALRALFNPLVVVTAMTAASLIAAVLALSWPSLSKRIFAVCAVIAVIGIITIAYELKRVYRLERNKQTINDLLEQGNRLVLDARARNPGRRIEDFPDRTFGDLEEHIIMEDWCKHAETVLRESLGQPYVTRLHLGGSNVQDATHMTIWKMNHRLETLASFLNELK